MELFKIFVNTSIIALIIFGLQVWSVRSALKKRIKDKGYIINEKRNHTSDVVRSEQYCPPISILKPLKGLDDNLLENLESFCLQDYPHYEIIFSLQDRNDPAYNIAMEIKEKYPERDITVLVKRCNVGLNAKVNNLIYAYERARFDYILVSDSHVIVGKDYLKETIKYMEDPHVGLVSNLMQGVGGRRVGSIFDNIHMNSFVIGGVCFLNKFFKVTWTFGSSILMRKRDLHSIGGFEGVKDVIAEDIIINKKIKKMGKNVILSNYVIENVNEYWGIKQFLSRHTRWAKIRWSTGGLRYISEFFTNCVFIASLPILIWEPSKLTISFAMTVSSLKAMGDMYLGSLVQGEGTDRNIGRELRIMRLSPLWYLLSPIKDLILGIIWFIPFFSKTVKWRGNRYIIRGNNFQKKDAKDE